MGGRLHADEEFVQVRNPLGSQAVFESLRDHLKKQKGSTKTSPSEFIIAA
jgi:hypothetical protein